MFVVYVYVDTVPFVRSMIGIIGMIGLFYWFGSKFYLLESYVYWAVLAFCSGLLISEGIIICYLFLFSEINLDMISSRFAGHYSNLN